MSPKPQLFRGGRRFRMEQAFSPSATTVCSQGQGPSSLNSKKTVFGFKG